MIVLRRRKDDLVTQQDSDPRYHTSPVKVYQRLVSNSSAVFRSDIEFVEKPRQIVFGAVLLGILFILSGFTADDALDTISASRYCLVGLLVATVIYSMLQSKDGLMIRPHPIIWRGIHGITFFYFLLLAMWIVSPPAYGIWIMQNIFTSQDLGSSPINPPNIESMDCSINGTTVFRQLTSLWFLAHVLGWWGKMCLLRDWQMCMIYSVSFEIVELSLMWLIPEFQECWWDSVFMDMLGANMLGMFMGQLTLRYLSCKEYVWEPLNTNAPFMAHAKHFMKRFTPFSWSEYYWPKDWKSWWLSSIMWIGALILEVNSFLIIHAFGIRPSHWILTARLILLGAQGAQSVPEWYEYVRGKTFRIGHNCWIVFMIGAMEVLLAMRYGRKGESYGSITPPTDILMIHATFLSLWLLWYIVSSYRGSNGRHRARTWLVLLRVIAHVPLLFLIRRWAV